ncbi:MULTISPECIES: hypothetical protein [Streptomyces]|uniref:hypothetical protein n=1 Tax=Streptomyces TaxID=1883 RepID=UPI001E59C921|nr:MULTISPECIES: hypothetical protein [Streptomyces]MCZ4096387.1 hypothetical protein [Streptomyces sp. H39-C1]
MSTPPDQPSAYPYPGPQSAAQPSPGFGPPVPAQQNPYAQPMPQQVPPQPGQPGSYYGPQGAPIPQLPPPPPGGGSGAGKAVLWAAVGALVASAFWGGGVLLLGGKDKDTATADLKGYKVQSDVCSAAEISAFKGKYPESDSSPVTYTLKHDALDDMYCDMDLKASGSTYADAYLSTTVQLHKTTDPSAEFVARWESYTQRKGDYKAEKVTGFGDAAYLITEDTISGSSGSRSVTLAVRDGWMTYQMAWSMYLSSLDKDKTPPSVSEVTGWVKSSTTATLAKLKN